MLVTFDKNTRFFFLYVKQFCSVLDSVKVTSTEWKVCGFGIFFRNLNNLLAWVLGILLSIIRSGIYITFSCLVCVYPKFSCVPVYVGALACINRGSILQFVPLRTYSRSTLEAPSSFCVMLRQQIRNLLWHFLGWTQCILGAPHINSSYIKISDGY